MVKNLDRNKFETTLHFAKDGIEKAQKLNTFFEWHEIFVQLRWNRGLKIVLKNSVVFEDFLFILQNPPKTRLEKMEGKIYEN